jgi:carbon monoxide dehydrogenase subunit G
MKIEGTRAFAAPPETVFAALVDPELVASTIPGVQEFTIESSERWHGVVRLPIGPKITFSFELVERVEPSRARLQAQGKTFGSTVRVDTLFDLAPADGGGTLMGYQAEVTLSGVLGRLSDPALKPIAELQVSGVMRAVEKRIASGPG